MCAYVSYQATVTGVLNRVDNAELVQHLTYNDDTHPDCRQTGSHGPEATIGHRQRPQHHQDQVHHRWLRTNTDTGQYLGHTAPIQKWTCLIASCQVSYMCSSFIKQAVLNMDILLDTVFQNDAPFISMKIAHPAHLPKKFLRLLPFWAIAHTH